VGIRGICENRKAEFESRNGCLKPLGTAEDYFLRFRFPASPQLFIGLNRHLVRLWSTDWFRDPDEEVRKCLQSLDEALNHR
jgi:hypothetical protein